MKLLTVLAQVPPYAGYSNYAKPSVSSGELTQLAAGPYQLHAIFICVMLLSALVAVVFTRLGTLARLIASVPFSLFILTIAAVPLEAATGFRLLDFTMAEAPSPTLSTLRLAAELLCYAAAWKCVPWLYVAKEALISFVVRLLTRR